ncbi:MAG: HAD family hydrolase [bacterium]|nr:HAD family hydrolase [bacterium]
METEIFRRKGFTFLPEVLQDTNAGIGNFQAVIFDLYNTLAYICKEDYQKTKQKMAKLAGAPEQEFLRMWRSITTDSTRGQVLTTQERAEWVLNQLEIDYDNKVIEAMCVLEEDLQLNQVYLYKGVKTQLKKLKEQGFKIGLISNCSQSTDGVLNNLGIANFFDEVLWSYELKLIKPDPLIYYHTTEKLQVHPRRCLYIGDGNDRELDGADCVGMVTVWLDQEVNSLHLSDKSLYYRYKIQDLSEIQELLI